MSFITIDKSLYPIIIIRINKEYFEENDAEIYMQEMTKFYEENAGKGLVIIYDLSLTLLIPEDRRKIGEWLIKKKDIIKNAVKGACYVQPDIFQKLTLKGIFAVKKPEWANKIVSSLDEGIKWANELLGINH